MWAAKFPAAHSVYQMICAKAAALDFTQLKTVDRFHVIRCVMLIIVSSARTTIPAMLVTMVMCWMRTKLPATTPQMIVWTALIIMGKDAMNVTQGSAFLVWMAISSQTDMAMVNVVKCKMLWKWDAFNTPSAQILAANVKLDMLWWVEIVTASLARSRIAHIVLEVIRV